MNKLILILISTLLISACASKPPYRPAEGNGYGYKEVKITEEKYRVHFKHRSDDRSEAMNFALLRAAELTKLKDYDWFIINNRETIIDKERVAPASGVSVGRSHRVERHCGLLGCSTHTEPQTNVGVSLNLNSPDKSEIESILEIRMGHGETPDSENAYNAKEVYENLSPLSTK
ncbi:CC0125/CC1285 family lipoprotein [Catenovulum sediminis]|uniref:Lipoprotein n=1 Tax=Catenovulum sediminis TaxID=1740262 RepID=A0ABV1RFF3_9ALTE